MEFGKWLRARRQRANLTVPQVARAANVTPQYVYKLEFGPANPSGVPPKPSVEKVDALAEAVGAPITEARAIIGYAAHSASSPQARRAAALLEVLPEDIQQIGIDFLIFLVEKFAPDSRAFENESPFPAETQPDFQIGDVTITAKSGKKRRTIRMKDDEG